MVKFNTFTIHDLMGFAVMAPLAIALYSTYWRFGRRPLHLLLANLMICCGLYCLAMFLSDNIVPQGTSSWATPLAPSYTLWAIRFATIVGLLAMPTVLHFALLYSRRPNFLTRSIRWVYAGALLPVPLVLTDLFMRERQTPLAETSSWSCCIPWMPEMGVLFVPLFAVYAGAWMATTFFAQFLLWRPAEEPSFMVGRLPRRVNTVRCGLAIITAGAMVDVVLAVLRFSGPSLFPITSLATAIILARTLTREHLDLEREKNRRDRELQIARRIQHDLMPDASPSLGGFDIAGWSQAAEEAGGDVYDFYVPPNGDCMILLADVSGHGVGPALLAAEVRALFRALSTRLTDVSVILEELHSLLACDLKDDWGVTCFLGRLDARSKELSYVSAGQAPLMFYSRRADEYEMKGATTIPLYSGILDIDSDTCHYAFEPGDMLVVPSDGLWEIENSDGLTLGTAGLSRILRTCRQGSASDVIDTVCRSVDNHGFIESALEHDCPGFLRGFLPHGKRGPFVVLPEPHCVVARPVTRNLPRYSPEYAVYIAGIAAAGQYNRDNKCC